MNSILKAGPGDREEGAASLVPAGQWKATLELGFRQQRKGCRLFRNAHQGPLYVQKAFYPEGPDLAHLYLLHPPGGLVSGDVLSINIALESGASVLATTPGAGRFYGARADRLQQQQHNRLIVGPAASLEWLPQETIVYSGAHASMETTVELDESSVFSGWEITSLGLPASGRKFDSGSLRQRLVVTQNERPVLIEHLQIDAATSGLKAARCGLQNLPVTGIFVCGPLIADELTIENLQKLCETVGSSGKAAVSQVNTFIVARYLGRCSEQAKRLFILLWETLRPILHGRQACHPRIWST